MSSRLAALLVLVTAVSLIVAACGSDDEPPIAKLPISPPPPDSAPASVVETVAKLLGVEADSSNGCTPTSGSGGDEFTVNLQDPGGGSSYQFDPSEMTFNVGDTVTFVLTADTEFHTFTVDGLCIDEAVDVDAPVTLALTFDKPGTFPLICIPHELNGMVGTITVN